jgi:hypothetical protein
MSEPLSAGDTRKHLFRTSTDGSPRQLAFNMLPGVPLTQTRCPQEIKAIPRRRTSLSLRISRHRARLVCFAHESSRVLCSCSPLPAID